MDSKDMDKSIVCGFFGPPCRASRGKNASSCIDRQTHVTTYPSSALGKLVG